MGEQTGPDRIEDLLPVLTPEAKATYTQALLAGWIPAADGASDGRALLCRLGLLAADPADNSRLVPVDPQIAAATVRRRLNRHTVRLEEYGSALVRELAVLSSFYEQVQTARPEPPVEDLVGLEVINEALEEAVGECEEEALTAQPGNRGKEALGRALARAESVLGRGVRMRTLYQHPARFSEATKEYVSEATSLGAEIRTLDEIPNRLMIFDRRIAFLAASKDSRNAVLVRHPALVSFLVDSFERDWGRASMYDTGYQRQKSDEQLNMVQESIMRLLVEGASDDVIARRMNLNVRTCRSHIAKILKAYGAQSRVQAAYLMGRSESPVSTG
ncbi:LuxR C-terminal-related transcriptional regulator [Streptacidiphilus sp. N1-12]|uniref:LuxR C-terminal-related transcriptional regulator n=2 Tax=Streptacidiphilus alkalitolerans TaxID=3342712 RepID=A0ABV6VC23_9ACTN